MLCSVLLVVFASSQAFVSAGYSDVTSMAMVSLIFCLKRTSRHLLTVVWFENVLYCIAISFLWIFLFLFLFFSLVEFANAIKSCFEFVDEILMCDHSNESLWAVLSCGPVYDIVQDWSNFWACGWNPTVWIFKWNQLWALLSCSPVYHITECNSRSF